MLKNLSILMVGNTNNYPLFLALGLKELGHNVSLYIDSEYLLHRPEAVKTNWAGRYPDWISDCSTVTLNDIVFESSNLTELINLVSRPFDLVILNGNSISLSHYVNSPYVAFLTGSDLSYSATYNTLDIISASWSEDFLLSAGGEFSSRNWREFITRQRNGIRSAKKVVFPHRGLIPSSDELLDELGVPDQDRFSITICNPDLRPAPVNPPKEPLKLFVGSRITFLDQKDNLWSDIDLKGTDVFLKGLGACISSGSNIKVRMVEKGSDVERAKDLISQLGIEDSITWLSEMSLESIYKEIIAADLIVDQFGASFPGMVTYDSLSLGRPVISNLRNDIFANTSMGAIPGIHCENEEQIAEALKSTCQDRSNLPRLSKQGVRFSKQHFTPKSAAAQLLNHSGFSLKQNLLDLLNRKTD